MIAAPKKKQREKITVKSRTRFFVENGHSFSTSDKNGNH